MDDRQTILQCRGYEYAKRHGLLEEYRDAWGVNMNRSPAAYKANWSHLKDVPLPQGATQ